MRASVIDRAAVEHPATVPYAHLAIRPYPEDLIEPAELDDGTPIVLRPIKPEDEPMWHELLDELLQTRRCGSDSATMFKADTHESAMRFCFVDYDRELTAVAEANVNGQQEAAGSRAAGERDWQLTRRVRRASRRALARQGLGNWLTQYCVRHAGRIQAREMYADDRPRQRPHAGRVSSRYGFEIGPESDPTLLLVTKNVP